jgi:mRNA-degrading endonuclease RelE of RelBE toxin-antitoxin system
MPWDLVITKPAERDLKALARNDRVRVNAAFESMRANPYSGDIKFVQCRWYQYPRRRSITFRSASPRS